MDILIQSKVVFDEVNHIYTLNGKELSGITSILHKYVFPDMYKNVSEKNLKAAAEYGTMVHNQLQMHFNGMPYDDELPEVRQMVQLLTDNSITCECTEFLVSDNENVASSIDFVSTELDIIDWKTTSKFDEEYVRWQLSIYAYLLELQDPCHRVRDLYCGWFDKKKKTSSLIKLRRFPDSYVKELLNAYATDATMFENPRLFADDRESEMIAKYYSLLRKKEEADAVVSKIQEQLDSISEELTNKMIEDGDSDLIRSSYSISYKPAYSYKKKKFDTDGFEKDHPEMVGQYVSFSDVNVKSKTTITFI